MRTKLLSLAALTFLLLGCAGEDARPDVVVVLVDALRADRFEPATMPRLWELSGEGTRFSTAIAQAPWTAPSVASLFTGLVSTAHGVVEHQGLGARDARMTTLNGELVTLAELFREAGWQTSAIVANTWLAPELGFGQGFERYESLRFKSPAGVVAAAARSFLASADLRRPRFLYLHLMDTHGPYLPPPELEAEFRERYPKRTLERGEFARLDYLAYGPYEDAEASDLATYQRRYDGGAAYADRELAALLEELRARTSRDTWIVFASDHGEAFFEHGYPDHGHTLHDELLRVPFFFVLPGVALPQVVDAQVELVDLLPTLVELLDLPDPPYPLSGRSLAGVLRGEMPPDSERPAGASCFIRGPARSAVRTEAFKLIVRSRGVGDLESQLFDLRSDPGETIDLAGRGEVLESLARRELAKLRERERRSGPGDLPLQQQELDATSIEALRALGYLD